MKAHKCDGCKYKSEHQEMGFKPFGVCTKKKTLWEADMAYKADKCFLKEAKKGTLYLKTPEGLQERAALEAAPEIEATTDWAEDNPTLARINSAFAEVGFIAKICTDAFAALVGITSTVMDACPNRRVVHLAKHATKRRTRKKNLHRAFRLLEKEAKK